MYFFTADEHYAHSNIIKYCDRPFKYIDEMDAALIRNHNEVVRGEDTTIHAGDFCFTKDFDTVQRKYIDKLNGAHIFLVGSHDYWLKGKNYNQIYEKRIDKQLVVVCHYAMRVWPASHYNSWLLYGHSHGNLAPMGKQHDVGVDNNNFYPVSFDCIRETMRNRPDNAGLIKGKR